MTLASDLRPARCDVPRDRPVARPFPAAGNLRPGLILLAWSVMCAACVLGGEREIASLSLDPQNESSLTLFGPDAQIQLQLTARYADGNDLADATRAARFAVAPEGIVRIDPSGLMIPLGDGSATVTAHLDGKSTTVSVKVRDFNQPRPIHFQNQVIPIFTKLGCNGGGCHGKASGQNGFKLSLLGFYPEDDYEFLVKESRGRRLFPAAPEQSLLLLKAIGDVPHGGGKRTEKGSYEYRVLLSWIAQGMPRGAASDPIVQRIECLPADRVMRPRADQQLRVIATYSDGRREDVTRMSLFEPNDLEMAGVAESGLVSTHDLSGEVAVMARYQGQVATFRATIPLGVETKSLPPVRNLIDEAVFGKLTLLGIPPSPICDDATFLRRVSLDITGSLPSADQVQTFLADNSPDKRDRLIDELLESPQYAHCFANKWNMVLRNKRRQESDRDGTFEFYQWIWDSLYDNKPYDQFVREILTAAGDPRLNPPVTWYREVASIESQVEDTAQLFLGLRIQCARCHHHPYERWSQDDYYGLAAFFSRVGRKDAGAETPQNTRDRRIFHNEGIAQVQNPRSGVNVRPAGLGSPPETIPAERDPRVALAAWMGAPENPFFARSLVNRYWKHFFNRGIVEPEDDMRETNPPVNPELLNGLARHFVESGYDLKGLVRLICRSSTYQLSSSPNEYNEKDKQNFSRYYPKRLTAESLYDAFHQVTGTTQEYAGLPPGTLALELPDASSAPYFLKVFGQPQGDTACECERSQAANLAQSLHLLNSTEVQTKISSASGRAHLLAGQSTRPHEDRIRELYRWVYAREPDNQELQAALEHIAAHSQDVNVAYEDLLWTLINTKEFLFNH